MPVAEETLAGPDGRRAADDRDGLRLECTDLGQDRLDRADIGVAAIVDRRAHADEDDLRGRARGPIEDADVARRDHGLECRLQPGLVERDAPVAQLDESLWVRLDELARGATLRQP